MIIPYDHLQRWWVEASPANPAHVADLRPSLIAFLAFGPGRTPAFVGSGFVAAGAPDFALVITAKHVLEKGVVAVQRPLPAYSASALFVPASLRTPSVSPEKLKAVWMGSEHAGMLDILHIGYNDTLDLACCIIAPQEQHAAPFHPVSLPIDTAVPVADDVVHMISLDNMTISELQPPRDASGIGHAMSLTRRVSIRVGVVTAVYPQGFRQYRWPCFTTSIPAEPGMSGGCVVLPREGKTIAACGIVCADNSVIEARTDFFQCGESVVASAWTALCLRAPDQIPSTPETPTRTLYEMMRAGRLDPAVGGIDSIDVIEMADGDCKIRRR